MDPSIWDTHDPTVLNVEITAKSSNMNAFIYGGESRKQATIAINGNSELTAGQTLSTTVDSGFLIVAYPTEDESDA